MSIKATIKLYQSLLYVLKPGLLISIGILVLRGLSEVGIFFGIKLEMPSEVWSLVALIVNIFISIFTLGRICTCFAGLRTVYLKVFPAMRSSLWLAMIGIALTHLTILMGATYICTGKKILTAWFLYTFFVIGIPFTLGSFWLAWKMRYLTKAAQSINILIYVALTFLGISIVCRENSSIETIYGFILSIITSSLILGLLWVALAPVSETSPKDSSESNSKPTKALPEYFLPYVLSSKISPYQRTFRMHWMLSSYVGKLSNFIAGAILSVIFLVIFSFSHTPSSSVDLPIHNLILYTLVFCQLLTTTSSWQRSGKIDGLTYLPISRQERFTARGMHVVSVACLICTIIIFISICSLASSSQNISATGDLVLLTLGAALLLPLFLFIPLQTFEFLIPRAARFVTVLLVMFAVIGFIPVPWVRPFPSGLIVVLAHLLFLMAFSFLLLWFRYLKCDLSIRDNTSTFKGKV